jgi:hypothetical protein
MDELGAMPEQQRAATMQQMQLVPGDPRLQQVIRVENDITDLEVDIDIEEGADVPALQAEQFSGADAAGRRSRASSRRTC